MKPNRLLCLILALMLLAVGCRKAPTGKKPSLHKLDMAGDIQKVQSRLAKGADINEKDKWGDTPLHIASVRGDPNVVKLLITNGANIDARNNIGDTPLIKAVKQYNMYVVEVLIAEGADINAQGVFLNTPLHWAAESGYKPVVQLLIENKARIDSKNRRGETPADLAINAGHRHIIDLLTSKGAGVTLHLAALRGDLEKLRSLIAEGTDVNTEDKEYRTALHLAAIGGHTEVVRLLLTKGANPNSRERIRGATPLHLAVEHGHEDVAAILITHGADVNAECGQRHETPLQIAASLGLKYTATLLIAQGADVNSRHESMWYQSDWTPLHYAASRGHIELVRLLIDKGAVLSQKDRQGNSAATFAMSANHRKIVEMLLAHGAEATINLAVYVGNLEKTRNLLTGDVDINQRDWYDRTLLGIAAEGGHIQVMEELIANGAEINIQDSNDPSQTDCPALHLAAMGGSTDAVKLLISNGANVNSRALHLAAYAGQREVVELFLANGAKIDSQDWNGSTPLYFAARSGHRDVVELLLIKGADIRAGRLGKILTLPDPAAKSIKEIAEQVITVCKPSSIIVSDPKSIRQYLQYNRIFFYDIWIPEIADIEAINPVLRAHLEKNIVVGAKEHFNPSCVLAQLYLYSREYSGFIKDSKQYICCQMIYENHPYTKPPDNTFTNIHGFANGVVRFVFEVQSKKIVQIDCEYIM